MRRVVAVEAIVSLRTVENYLDGKSIQATTGARIAGALRDLGLEGLVRTDLQGSAHEPAT
jgi:hypothetical protein